MAIGAALAKHTTYGEILDIVKARTRVIDDPLISDSLIIKEISQSVQKLAGVLNGATAPFYSSTILIENSITGSANPYTLDLSSIVPFLDKIVRVVHIAGATRTLVKMLSQEEAERVTSLSNIHAGSLFGVWEGDAIRFYAGSSFTVTTGSDDVEIKYSRQPIVVGSIGAVVTAATFTATGTAITALLGTPALAAHVGGLFVGTDFGANKFVRGISAFVSSSAIAINSPLTADGAGTSAYILPPHTVPLSTSSKPDIPDKYVPLVILDVQSKVQQMKANGVSDPSVINQLDTGIRDIYREFSTRKQMEEIERVK